MIALLLLAATFQDIAGLDRAVAAFTGHAVGDDGGARAAIDARLRLASCPTVSLSWRSDAHDAVVVTCAGPDPSADSWRIFVPVYGGVPAGATHAAPAVIAKVEPVIRRGDPVLIEAGDNGFQITREGVAAADAAPGARVAVRVDGATQPVQAVAVANGRATLPGWTPENR